MAITSKQDGTYTRTAAQLEQKYQFGKTFAEMLGLINESRDHVDAVESTLRSEMSEQVTSIVRDTEHVLMSALEDYSLTTDLESFKQTMKSELSVMADRISMNFNYASEQISKINGELETVTTDLQKHFDFNVNGLTIKMGESEMKLRLDNDMIGFYKGEIDEDDLTKNRFGWWDGVNFNTGNIVVNVNERAQFGNFAYVPRSNGSLSFLKVGG